MLTTIVATTIAKSIGLFDGANNINNKNNVKINNIKQQTHIRLYNFPSRYFKNNILI